MIRTIVVAIALAAALAAALNGIALVYAEPPQPSAADLQALAGVIRQQRDQNAQAANDAIADRAVLQQQLAAERVRAAALDKYWADYVAGLTAPPPADAAAK
jgi:hypothetical protein